MPNHSFREAIFPNIPPETPQGQHSPLTSELHSHQKIHGGTAGQRGALTPFLAAGGAPEVLSTQLCPGESIHPAHGPAAVPMVGFLSCSRLHRRDAATLCGRKDLMSEIWKKADFVM